MARFAILRTKKLKTFGGVNLALKHGYREQKTPNADASARDQNSELVSENRKAALKKFNERLASQVKIRSNAVLAIEYLVSASPEAMATKTKDDQDAYLGDSLEFIKNKHGHENVFAAVVHRDENTNPHMSVWVVPIDQKGKLNCREFLGGAEKLKELQTDFAEKVGAKHSLERGMKGSKATHTEVKKYYARVREASQEPKKIIIPEPKALEGRAAYGERAANFVQEAFHEELMRHRAEIAELKEALKKEEQQKLRAQDEKKYEAMANEGTLPKEFERWEMKNNFGNTIAHIAASRGHLPKDFDQWELKNNKTGETVAHTAFKHGHLPDSFPVDKINLIPKEAWPENWKNYMASKEQKNISKPGREIDSPSR